jgi:hypothetical protein
LGQLPVGFATQCFDAVNEPVGMDYLKFPNRFSRIKSIASFDFNAANPISFCFPIRLSAAINNSVR